MYLEQDWSFKINYLDVNLVSNVKDFKHCRVKDLWPKDDWNADFDKFERWACVNIMKLHRAKWKVLHMEWGNPEHKYRLGSERIGSSPV